MRSPDFYRKDDYKEYYKVLRIFMKINGLWPYHTIYKMWFNFIVTMILVEAILLGEIWEVIEVWPDLNSIIDCTPNILISLVLGAEYAGLFCNTDKLKKCLDRIAEDWRNVSKAELDLLKLYAVQGQKLAKAYLNPLFILSFIFAVYMSITGFMFLLQPFIEALTTTSDNSTDVTSTIPYRVQYGIDLTKYYYEIIVFCYLTVVSHMGILCSINLVYTLFIQHCCGLFAVIGYKLKRIGEKENLESEQNVQKRDDANYWIALECLRRHIQAIEFSELVEGAFSSSFLFGLGLHMLGLAVAGTQVLMHSDDFNETVRYVSLAISILIQLLWQCWQAQRILDYSNVPYECAIEAQWYKTSKRCKKILILIMLRSTRPCEITAGKLITLSIETFSSVLRTSMSYFTVLQSMQYYRNNMRFLRLIGLWPYQLTFTKFIRSFTMFIIAESILIPETFGLIKVARVSTINVLECLPAMVIGVACGLKLLNMAYNNEKIKMLLGRVMTDWSLITTEREIQILRSYSERARQFTMGYAYWMLCTFVMFASLPLLSILQENSDTIMFNETSIIPFEVDYLVDTNKYYYPILIHCYLCIFIHGLIIVAVDTIFITFVQHTCGMFSILSYQLEHMTDIESEDLDFDSTKDRIQRKIAHCIFKHNELLNTVDLMESTYSTYFFIQLGLNMINMSITAVQTMMNAGVPHEFIRHFANTMAQLFHLFFECWQAQQIIDHSVMLRESIGKSEWYQTSEKSKKLIVIMLMRSLVTSKLTAGKMIVLCFESFTADSCLIDISYSSQWTL